MKCGMLGPMNKHQVGGYATCCIGSFKKIKNFIGKEVKEVKTDV